MANGKQTKSASLVLRSRKTDDTEESDAEAERLAAEAFDHINRLERRAKLELVIEVGDYLVGTFFHGDLDLARSFSPTKPKALNRLEARALGAEIAPSQLRTAIAMSCQYRALPATVRDRLSVRQYRALLPVRDDQQRSRLARRALSEKISGPALAELVRQEHGPSNRGRKPLSTVEKALNAARRALVSATLEAALEPPKMRALDEALRAKLLHDARTLRERIERVADALARVR